MLLNTRFGNWLLSYIRLKGAGRFGMIADFRFTRRSEENAEQPTLVDVRHHNRRIRLPFVALVPGLVPDAVDRVEPSVVIVSSGKEERRKRNLLVL